MNEKIKIFTSPLCPPCVELKNKLTPDELQNIEFIDINTEAGLKEAMDKRIIGVPFAEKDGKKCRIIQDNNKITFDCDQS